MNPHFRLVHYRHKTGGSVEPPVVFKSFWLGGRDSNPDSQIQSLESYHWTTSQQGIPNLRIDAPLVNHASFLSIRTILKILSKKKCLNQLLITCTMVLVLRPVSGAHLFDNKDILFHASVSETPSAES